MKNLLRNYRTKHGVLIADGATGTNYFSKGLETGDPPELWNLVKPDNVIDLHKEFIKAGANIILTNTFGANSSRLKIHNCEEKVKSINIKAATLAKKAINLNSVNHNENLIGGSVGPTGELFQSIGGNLSFDEAVRIFSEQAINLKEGGVDFLWIETLSSLEEVDAAMHASEKAELGAVVTMSFDTSKRTMMGVTPEEFLKFIGKRKIKPIGIGANCGVGPPELLLSMKEMKEHLEEDILLVAKGNCGIPEYKDGEIHYKGTEEIMAKYAGLCKELGVDIVGGCCGTTPSHIKAIKKIVTSKTFDYQSNDTLGKSSIHKEVSVERISNEVGVPWESSFSNDFTPKSQLRRTSRRRVRRI